MYTFRVRIVIRVLLALSLFASPLFSRPCSGSLSLSFPGDVHFPSEENKLRGRVERVAFMGLFRETLPRIHVQACYLTSAGCSLGASASS